MRKSLAAATVVLVSLTFAPPANADSERPRPVQPAYPRGYDARQADPPEQANTPATGSPNKFDHGNKPVRPAALTLAGTDSLEIARSERPRPLPPTTPRGLDKGQADRPDQANSPGTGNQNRSEHGNKPVRLAALNLAGTDSLEIARSERPRPIPPAYPRGYDRRQADSPEQANTPRTGPGNQFDHGNKPVRPAALTLAGTDSLEIARSERPRPVPPGSPRGLVRSGADRPDEANTPRTGPTNSITRGNKPERG